MMKSKMASISILVVILGMAFVFPGIAASQEVIVIANPKVPVGSLTGDEVKDIFLAKKTQWDNGQKINFVTLKDCDTHRAFLKQYLQKSSSQFERYFRTLVFTGKGSIPKAFDTEEQLVHFVSSTDGAIGYVSRGANTGSAKVITVN